MADRNPKGDSLPVRVVKRSTGAEDKFETNIINAGNDAMQIRNIYRGALGAPKQVDDTPYARAEDKAANSSLSDAVQHLNDQHKE